MEIVINSDNGYNRHVDESLFDVYVRVYDNDGYHRSIEETSLEAKVRRMSSRPRTMNEYLESIRLYDEWMEMLYDKHINKEIFKLKLEAGLIDDYVPAKPKPKNKFIKAQIKMGIIVHEPNPRDIVPMDEVSEWARVNLAPETDEVYEVDYDSKEYKKAHKESYNSVVEICRGKYSKLNKNMKKFRASRNPMRSDIDFTTEYFLMKNKKSSKKKKGKKKKNKGGYEYIYDRRKAPKTLKDLCKANYMDKMKDIDPVADYNGILLASSEIEDIEVYHALHKLGWNSYSLMKRGHVPKRVCKQFKAKFSNKKKKKKKNKNGFVEISFGKDDQGSTDAILNAILDDGGYDSFEEYQRDMLDMTSENIFRHC